MQKDQEAYEAGYVSGVAASLEKFVQVVHEQEGMVGKAPGIFQLVIPAELVEDTLNELLPLLGDGDIIIDHGNSNFKDSRRRAERLDLKWASNILTAVLVVEFTVWSVDTVLWLVVQVAQYLSVPPFSGHSHLALPLHPAQTNLLAQLVPNMDGYTAVDLVQDTLSKWFTMV